MLQHYATCVEELLLCGPYNGAIVDPPFQPRTTPPHPAEVVVAKDEYPMDPSTPFLVMASIGTSPASSFDSRSDVGVALHDLYTHHQPSPPTHYDLTDNATVVSDADAMDPIMARSQQLISLSRQKRFMARYDTGVVDRHPPEPPPRPLLVSNGKVAGNKTDARLRGRDDSSRKISPAPVVHVVHDIAVTSPTSLSSGTRPLLHKHDPLRIREAWEYGRSRPPPSPRRRHYYGTPPQSQVHSNNCEWKKCVSFASASLLPSSYAMGRYDGQYAGRRIQREHGVTPDHPVVVREEENDDATDNEGVLDLTHRHPRSLAPSSLNHSTKHAPRHVEVVDLTHYLGQADSQDDDLDSMILLNDRW